MIKKGLPIIYLSLIMLSYAGCMNKNHEDIYLVKYLNQPAPGTKPVVFAKNFLPPNNRDAAFSPDGREFFFTRVKEDSFTIMHSKFTGGQWTAPAAAPFSGVYNDFEPCISPDGKKFFFASMRPSDVKKEMENDIDIWVMEKEHDTWGPPELLEETINTSCMEYYPSITGKGTLYFGRNDPGLTRGDIYRSELTGNGYSAPEKLPETVNLPGTSFNAFISPDESFLVFSTYIQEDSALRSDLHISFKDGNGEWTEPQNMGEPINSKGNDLSPWVSHDQEYLFFSSTRLDSTGQNKNHNIFWVDASVIEKFRPSELRHRN